MNTQVTKAQSGKTKVTEVQAQVATKAWRAYQKADTDEQLPWKLAEKYLPLVKSIVSRMRIYFPQQIAIEDIYSVGLTGLIMAIQKYDPSKGRSFGSYATLRVRGSILDELRRLDWMPRSSRSLAKQYYRTLEVLEQRLGRVVTESEVRVELGMNEDQFSVMLDKLRPISFISLDKAADLDDPDGPSIHEVVSDGTQLNARERCEEKEVIKLVREHIEKLPKMVQKVLGLYYFEGMRLAEIAKIFELSESRICQIHSQAVIRLRLSIAKVTNQ